MVPSPPLASTHLLMSGPSDPLRPLTDVTDLPHGGRFLRRSAARVRRAAPWTAHPPTDPARPAPATPSGSSCTAGRHVLLHARASPKVHRSPGSAERWPYAA